MDFIVCATNPDVGCTAEVSVNIRVGDPKLGLENNVGLMGPFNLVGNPACSWATLHARGQPCMLVGNPACLWATLHARGQPCMLVDNPGYSVPIGMRPSADGKPAALPVGMPIVGRHHPDQLVLDLALALESERPLAARRRPSPPAADLLPNFLIPPQRHIGWAGTQRLTMLLPTRPSRSPHVSDDRPTGPANGWAGTQRPTMLLPTRPTNGPTVGQEPSVQRCSCPHDPAGPTYSG